MAAKTDLMNTIKEFSEVLDTQYSDIKSDYDNGYIGLDEYITSLSNLTNDTNASAEQIETWTEELEDSTLKLAEMKYSEGKMSDEEYKQILVDQMHNNDVESDDYATAKDKYFALYDSRMQKESSRRELLDDNDFDGKIQSLETERLISAEKLAALTADEQ